MRFEDLNPEFVVCEVRDGVEHMLPSTGPANGFELAHGVCFDCPCGGDHSLCVWFRGRGAPKEATPSPRWNVSGASVADITLEPSVNARCWHGFVRN